MVETSARAARRQLRKALEEPAILSHLFSGRPDRAPTGAWPAGVRWQRQRQFYPQQHEREIFKVTWPSGESYALKMNINTQCVAREGMLLDWLPSVRPARFVVPEIVDRELMAYTVDGTACGWLLTTWLDGVDINPDRAGELAPHVGCTLAELHILGEDWQALARRNGIVVPPIQTLRDESRERQIADVEAASELASKNLVEPLYALMAALTDQQSGRPVCLVNGDFHLNNLLLPRDGKRKWSHFVWLDWEGATVDDPLSDLAHCLANLTIFDGPSIGEALTAAYLEAARARTREHGDRSTARALWLWRGVWMVRFLNHRVRMVQSVLERASIVEAMARHLGAWLHEEVLAHDR